MTYNLLAVAGHKPSSLDIEIYHGQPQMLTYEIENHQNNDSSHACDGLS